MSKTNKTIIAKIILSTIAAFIPNLVVSICSLVIYCFKEPCPQTCGRFTIFLDVYLRDWSWVISLIWILVWIVVYLLLTIIIRRKIKREHE